jgi:hypothetical protein
MRAAAAILLTAGCVHGNPSHVDAGGDAVDAAIDAPDPLAPGTYRETCDGSGAVALDSMHFLDVNDENQGLRIYTRATDGPPLQTFDLSAGLGVTSTDEVDLEDLARVGDRVFAIASHGRDSSGDLQPTRYRFAAFDLAGALPNLSFGVVGSTSTLLVDLLDSANWDTPDINLITTLDTSSKLTDAHTPSLAPELAGTNIEGLAFAPIAGEPDRMVIGFRNPQPGGSAIVISLVNAPAAVTGSKAHFGGAAQLDLGGLGVRGMAYSAAHTAVLILAGPHDSGGPFRIYKWSGELAVAPVLVGDVVPPGSSAAEAIVPYPGSKDVQILFDQGDAMIGGTTCKKAAPAARVFRDVIVHVE